MTASSENLTVEIWSDVICPWCWIGLTKFNKALKDFEHADQVTIVHHAYRLMPGVAPRPVNDILVEKMGLPPSQVPAALRQVEQAASSEGLTYRLEGTFLGDTLAAHRLIKLAQTQGKGHEMLVRFYRAYLSEQLSVLERDSLLALATDVGLDRDEAQAVLDGDRFRAEVEADQRGLQALGGRGVPFFLVGGRHALSGAQPSEHFARALNQAWADLPNRPDMIAEGAVCGPDGCDAP